MSPIETPKVAIETDVSHSCNNWMCCFGCRCVKKDVSTPVPKKESPISVESVERITRTYERHRVHHKKEESSNLKRSREIQDLSDIRIKASVDLGLERKD